MKDSDPEIKEMAELEFETLKQSIDDLEIELKDYYSLKILMTLKMFS